MCFEGWGVGILCFVLCVFFPTVIYVLWRLVDSRHLYDDSFHFRQNVDFISPHRPCAARSFLYRVVFYVHNIQTSV